MSASVTQKLIEAGQRKGDEVRAAAKRAVESRAVQRHFYPGAFVRSLGRAAELETQAEEKPEAGDGPIEAVINTATVDRYDSIVDPRGANLDNYLENPILQWAHGMDFAIGTWPVGRVLSVTRSDSELAVSLEFDTEGTLGAELDRLYRQGWLRGFSIGFIPHSFVVEQIDGRDIIRYTEWELVELSCVSVPANPEALSRALEAGEIHAQPLVRWAASRSILPPGCTADTAEDAPNKAVIHDKAIGYIAQAGLQSLGTDQKAARDAAAGVSRTAGGLVAVLHRTGAAIAEGELRYLDSIIDGRGAAVRIDEPDRSGPARLFLCQSAGTRLELVEATVSRLRTLKELGGVAEAFEAAVLVSPVQDASQFAVFKGWQQPKPQAAPKAAEGVRAGESQPEGSGNPPAFDMEAFRGCLRAELELVLKGMGVTVGSAEVADDKPAEDAVPVELTGFAAARGVDGEGGWSLEAECRAATEAQRSAMAALVIERDGQPFAMFVHHRHDGRISWPALAAGMARLLTQPVDLTAEQKLAVYDHLAEHYRELDIVPPEAGAKTPGEAYDLALEGRLAMLDDSGAYLYSGYTDEADGAKRPVFKAIDGETLIGGDIPQLGRLTDWRHWGQRSVAPKADERLLSELATTQRALVELQEQRAGAEFSSRNRRRITEHVESLEGMAGEMASLAKQLRRQAAELRSMIEQDSDGETKGDSGHENRGDGGPRKPAETGGELETGFLREIAGPMIRQAVLDTIQDVRKRGARALS